LGSKVPKAKFRLIRNRDALPSWFPLQIYSMRLTAEQWLEALAMRLVAQTAFEHTGDLEEARSTFTSLVVERLPSADGTSALIDEAQRPGDLWGIRELPAFDAAYIASMLRRSKRGAELMRAVEAISTSRDSRRMFIEPPMSFKAGRLQSFADLIDDSKEPYFMSDVLAGIPVVIDVRQDDESLIAAFRVWLAGARHKLGSARRPFEERDFNAWQEYAVLPTFDLKYWARIHGLRLADSVVADAIWPHSEFDAAERLRKVTRLKLQEVLGGWDTVNRLWRQLELVRAFKRTIDGLPNAQPTAGTRLKT
jgi:hypothetical protein